MHPSSSQLLSSNTQPSLKDLIKPHRLFTGNLSFIIMVRQELVRDQQFGAGERRSSIRHGREW
jgi:hypothetical protein